MAKFTVSLGLEAEVKHDWFNAWKMRGGACERDETTLKCVCLT